MLNLYNTDILVLETNGDKVPVAWLGEVRLVRV
jgi:hypothetical protein